MGLVQRFRETFNIAGILLTIEVDEQVYSQGDSVSGTLFLKGGEYNRDLEKISLQLREYWMETRQTGKTTTVVTVYRDEQTLTLAGPTPVPAASEASYRFDMQLPRNCRISAYGCGYCVWAQLKIKGAVDPKCKVDLDVQPTESLTAVVAALEDRMGFQERTKKRGWNSKTEHVWFRLKPPTVLLAELDYLALDLRETDEGSVTGTLVFNLQEKSIADYFRAILRRDFVKKPISLTSADLFLEDGSVNHDAIAREVAAVMKSVVGSESGSSESGSSESGS